MRSIVFMGTPDFAVPALEALIKHSDYDVKLVVSQTDKPQGRKQVMTPPPVKALALQHGIEIYQPVTLKTEEAYNKIASCEPDFIVVSAYGKILPPAILKIPAFGCVNLHGSLLPKYRGAAPIQWSVINGEKFSGVTTMLMDEGIDTGDILLKEEKEIAPDETAGELFDALAALCPELLIKTLKGLEAGAIVPEKQDEAKASYTTMLTKEMSVIDWSLGAHTICNLIRGLNPWPVAKTAYCNKALKIYAGAVSDKKSNGTAGKLFSEKNRIFVYCGENSVLELLELQLEGSKRMSAAAFLLGHPLNDNIILG